MCTSQDQYEAKREYTAKERLDNFRQAILNDYASMNTDEHSLLDYSLHRLLELHKEYLDTLKYRSSTHDPLLTEGIFLSVAVVVSYYTELPLLKDSLYSVRFFSMRLLRSRPLWSPTLETRPRAQFARPAKSRRVSGRSTLEPEPEGLNAD